MDGATVDVEVLRVWSRRVRDVLDGVASYDSLDASDQSVVRAEWDRRMALLGDELDLEAEFRAAGIDSWVETDDDGKIVLRGTDSRAHP